MKLSTRSITILKVLAIMVMLALMVITMFYPEYSRNPYSIVEIESKQEEVLNMNNTLQSNEAIIDSESANLERLKDMVSSLEKEHSRAKAGIGDTDFSLHVPSLLVKLEQQAKENEIEIKIDYENIKTHNANEPEMPNDHHDDYGEEEEYNRENFDEELSEESEELGMGSDELSDESLINDESIESSDETLDVEDTVGQSGLSEEHSDITSEVVQINIPTINGLSVTTVKINLNGTYENIRKFVFAIDEIDFIEHNVIDILSYGDKVSTVIILNVFHTENGGGIDE